MKELEIKERMNKLYQTEDPKIKRVVRTLVSLHNDYFDFNRRNQLSPETRGVIVWNAIDDILTALETDYKKIDAPMPPNNEFDLPASDPNSYSDGFKF